MARQPEDHQSQCFQLPPSLDDWLPEEDEARFVCEVVEDLLDLSAIYVSYESASGAPPYDPRMMLKLLFYGMRPVSPPLGRLSAAAGGMWRCGVPDCHSISRFGSLAISRRSARCSSRCSGCVPRPGW